MRNVAELNLNFRCSAQVNGESDEPSEPGNSSREQDDVPKGKDGDNSTEKTPYS